MLALTLYGPLILIDTDMPVVAANKNPPEKLRSNMLKVWAGADQLYPFANKSTKLEAGGLEVDRAGAYR